MSQGHADKKILIMGLGLNEGGAGTARFFLAHGADVLVTDLKSKKELWPSIKKLQEFKKKCGQLSFILGRHRKKDFKGVDLVIQGPGVPNDSPFLIYAKKNKIPIDTDMGIFFENCPAPIIGVTGSKGKSTTAALIYNILKQKFKDVILAGNIGKSPLDYIGSIKPTTKVVLELSSWQLEGLARHKKSPHIAVITNILKEHLNRYKSFRHYAAAKALIFKYQKEGDFLAVSQQANRIIKPRLKKNKQLNVRVFSTRSPGLLIRRPGLLVNMEAASTVGQLYKVSKRAIFEAVKNFKELPGRQEKIARINGVSYYNDTTATMPDAVILALNSIKPEDKGKIILIAGGTDKKLDFGEMAKEIRKWVSVLILLPGDATDKIKSQIPKFAFSANSGASPVESQIIGFQPKSQKVFEAASMKEAVTLAYKNSQKGDMVILSPGAASFGLFQNEFDRGRKFVQEVLKLRYRRNN